MIRDQKDTSNMSGASSNLTYYNSQANESAINTYPTDVLAGAFSNNQYGQGMTDSWDSHPWDTFDPGNSQYNFGNEVATAQPTTMGKRFGSTITNRINEELSWCKTCHKYHDTNVCPQMQASLAHRKNTASNTPSKASKTGSFPFLELPPEIRLEIYDAMCLEADKKFTTISARKFTHGNALILDSSFLNDIAHVIKGPYTVAFAGLVTSNHQLRDEVSAYLLAASVRRTKELQVSVIWFEDLGHFLLKLGPQGRQHLTNLSFTWDNKPRQKRGCSDISTPLGRESYRDKDGPEKIFKMLATCRNLQNLTVRLDSWRLLHNRPDGSCVPIPGPSSGPRSLDLWDIPGMQALRTVKVRGDLKLHYTRDWEKGPEPKGFVQWLESGMKDFSDEDGVVEQVEDKPCMEGTSPTWSYRDSADDVDMDAEDSSNCSD